MKTLFKLSILVVALALVGTSCLPDGNGVPPLETVSYVDVNRYLGKWYEIASIPQFFSKGCNCTTAEYSTYPNGVIKVKNSCNLNNVNGILNTIIGSAVPERGSNNTKLKVSFTGTPTVSNYWIIDLADDYSYAVVSDPLRSTCFILSRIPTMDEATYQSLLSKAASKGIDISKIKRTPQEGCQ
jgi:apolipoprotein D and lipocalin family protein